MRVCVRACASVFVHEDDVCFTGCARHGELKPGNQWGRIFMCQVQNGNFSSTLTKSEHRCCMLSWCWPFCDNSAILSTLFFLLGERLKTKNRILIFILRKHTSVIEFHAEVAFFLVTQWHHRNNETNCFWQSIYTGAGVWLDSTKCEWVEHWMCMRVKLNTCESRWD